MPPRQLARHGPEWEGIESPSVPSAFSSGELLVPSWKGRKNVVARVGEFQEK